MFFTQTKVAFMAVLIATGALSACRDPAPQVAGIDEAALHGPGWSNPGATRPLETPMEKSLNNSAGGDRVFFDVDKSTIRGEGRALLVKWADYLKQSPNDRLVIEGHSDEHGTREYNLALGDRRANAVKDILIVNGIQAARIKTVSYGKERPAVAGSDDASYAQNRRAVGILM